MKERANKLLKKLDIFLGIPLVLVLGIFKKIFRRKIKFLIDKTKPLTIGVLKEAAIGDLAILSGVLKDIEKWLPNAKLILCCSKENVYLANLLDLKLNMEVEILPMAKPLELFRMIFSLPKMDLWMDFGQWPRINAIISFFVKAKCKLGFKTPGQFRHYVYDIIIQHSEKRHEIENYREFLRALEIPTGSLPALRVVQRDIKLPKKFVVFHMFPGGSRAYLKIWCENYWIELGNFFMNKNFSVILTGSGKDFERAEKVRIKIKNPNNKVEVINKAGEWSIEDTMFAISRSILVISVDTAIIHMASAINTNLIGLYGPTSFSRWGPLSKKSIVVSVPQNCSPCLNLGFESRCKDNKCMKMIKVEDVIEAARTLLPSL